MPSKKLDEEFKVLVAKVKEAAKALTGRHYIWMIDAALGHYQETIKKEEMELIRHQMFIGEPHEGYHTMKYDRKEEIEKIRGYMTQNRAIVVFLQALGELAHHIDNVNFAESIDWSSFGSWRTKK
jgi:hypothetical protein